MGHIQPEFQKDLDSVLEMLRRMLIEKNIKYGDSALNPRQIFSSSTPDELINVRIDDKLNRILNRQNNEDEDVVGDLLGYLILKQIYKLRMLRGKANAS